MSYTTISETVTAFDDMTNDLFGPVLVGGCEYDHAEAWARLEDDFTFERDRW